MTVFNRRFAELSNIVRQQGLDGIIITGGENISYLCGFFGDDSILLTAAGKKYLITDSRYTLQAKKQCRFCRGLKIIERKKSMPESICLSLKKIRGVKKIGIEDSVSVKFFKGLKKKLFCRLSAVSGTVERLRRIKDNGEIAAIKKSAKIAQKVLAKVLPRIESGITESALAAMMDYEMKKSGAEPAFETIVAFGSNSAFAHHRPTLRKLKKNDTILLDFGARFNGYCCDITRCFAVGKMSRLYKKVYETVYAAQQAAIAAIKAGEPLKAADEAAKAIIKAAGFPAYGHGLGHGLGLAVHESPSVSAVSKDKFEAGNIITIEPAVYLAGKFGIRIEDDCLVKKDGCGLLTICKKLKR